MQIKQNSIHAANEVEQLRNRFCVMND